MIDNLGFSLEQVKEPKLTQASLLAQPDQPKVPENTSQEANLRNVKKSLSKLATFSKLSQTSDPSRKDYTQKVQIDETHSSGIGNSYKSKRQFVARRETKDCKK